MPLSLPCHRIRHYHGYVLIIVVAIYCGLDFISVTALPSSLAPSHHYIPSQFFPFSPLAIVLPDIIPLPLNLLLVHPLLTPDTMYCSRTVITPQETGDSQLVHLSRGSLWIVVSPLEAARVLCGKTLSGAFEGGPPMESLKWFGRY
jgi:hypothetical protein